jgi:hypothetical protein
MFVALGQGLPLVVIPLAGDQPENAVRWIPLRVVTATESKASAIAGGAGRGKKYTVTIDTRGKALGETPQVTMPGVFTQTERDRFAANCGMLTSVPTDRTCTPSRRLDPGRWADARRRGEP